MILTSSLFKDVVSPAVGRSGVLTQNSSRRPRRYSELENLHGLAKHLTFGSATPG